MKTNQTRMTVFLLLAVGVAAIVVMWTRHVSEPVTVNPPTVDGKNPVFVLMPTPVPARLDKTPPRMVVEASGAEPQKVVVHRGSSCF